MAKKPFNPAVGTEFLKIQLTNLFASSFDEAGRAKIEREVLGGRPLDDLLNLKPDTPLGDFMLLLVSLRGTVDQKINLTWHPADFMVMRHNTENFDKEAAIADWAGGKEAFIRSCGSRTPSAQELADYDNPDPMPLSEPAWMRSIPLSSE